MELTAAIRKQTYSLNDAKNRRRCGLFKAEGTKCVLDTLGHFRLAYLVATDAWLSSHPLSDVDPRNIAVAPRHELERMSHLSTAPEVIAVYHLPEPTPLSAIDPHRELIIALDGVQDPGNLGTIIRTADWYGITTIVCSIDTADSFSPKVIQSTMGAISRVRVIFTDLAKYLSAQTAPIYGTFLGGESLYSANLSATGIIIMGNEGKGISAPVAQQVSRRLTIPSYPPSRPTSESLNVATATAITLSEFRRRQLI